MQRELVRSSLINLFLINSALASFSVLVDLRCTFTFAVDLNCVTEINVNVSCTIGLAYEPKHSFKRSPSWDRFFGIFIVHSVYFSASFFSHSSLLWIAFRREKKMLLKCFLRSSWTAWTFLLLRFNPPFLLINYRDLDYFSSFPLLSYKKSLFVNYKVSAFASSKKFMLFRILMEWI